MKPKRIDILGVPVDCVTKSEALDRVKTFLHGQKPEAVIAVNPEKVMAAREDSALLEHLQTAGLLIPDGIGVVFAMRLLGLTKTERVPGAELMPMICEIAAHEGHRIFLFGASNSVNEETAHVLRARFPGICIVGNTHGYINKNEMVNLIQEINASQADILFVALGSPKQEEWMIQFLPKLCVKVCQGVGGTFDVLSGRVHRAPLIFRQLHLEWFYRLLAQPSRLFRQTSLPQFAIQVLRERLLTRNSSRIF